MLETLGNAVLYSIEDTEVREWDIPAETTLLRVSLPSSPENSAAMFKRGYLLGDRTILCTIPTRNLPDNLGKSVRVKATLENADHDAMFELSRSSFLGQSPEDYKGYHIANFDDENGKFESIEPDKVWEGKPHE